MMHEVTLSSSQNVQKTSTELPPAAVSQPTKLMKCRAHKLPHHNFFLSYRVNSEGTKCNFSQVVYISHV